MKKRHNHTDKKIIWDIKYTIPEEKIPTGFSIYQVKTLSIHSLEHGLKALREKQIQATRK